MNIKETLRFINTYFQINRGVGHTRLMNIGTDNYQKDKLVLCNTMDEGDKMKLRRSEIVSLNSLERFRSRNCPLIIDHHALEILFTKAIEEIEKLENGILDKAVEKEKIDKLEKDLKKQKTNVAILKSLLRNSMKDLIDKETKIQEMENHPFKTFFKTIFNGNTSKSTP